MKVIYVAGPYRASTLWGVTENIRAAEAVALELWREGYAALCPHKNTAYFDGAVGGPEAPGGGEVCWLAGDLAMLERCDAVVLVPGWPASRGARAEMEHAEANGIPVLEWRREAGDRVMFFEALARRTGERRAR